MRLTGGIAKGRKIYSRKGLATRPALSRVRNSIFNILASSNGIEGKNVLDLFAGSGSLGLEALSRSANYCIFVDSALPCVKAIAQNIKTLRFEARAKVIKKNVFSIVPFLVETNFKFDIIFIAPPYDFFVDAVRNNKLSNLLSEMTACSVTDANTLFIVEHRAKNGFERAPSGLTLADQRKYGQTEVEFYRKVGG